MAMQRGSELRFLCVFRNCCIGKGCVLLLQSPVHLGVTLQRQELTPNPSGELVLI